MNRRWLAIFTLGLAGCATQGVPMPTVTYVDLPKFMGDWYVIANIPTFIERDAHNAVESYRLDADGTIATTFTFRAGAFDGERKRYNPRGFVVDRASNALWGMQFIWPIKSDYRIAWLADDYSLTLIAREQRDYLWIMARQPAVAEQDYQRVVSVAKKLGYDASLIRKVPQQWP